VNEAASHIIKAHAPPLSSPANRRHISLSVFERRAEGPSRFVRVKVGATPIPVPIPVPHRTPTTLPDLPHCAPSDESTPALSREGSIETIQPPRVAHPAARAPNTTDFLRSPLLVGEIP